LYNYTLYILNYIFTCYFAKIAKLDPRLHLGRQASITSINYSKPWSPISFATGKLSKFYRCLIKIRIEGKAVAVIGRFVYRNKKLSLHNCRLLQTHFGRHLNVRFELKNVSTLIKVLHQSIRTYSKMNQKLFRGKICESFGSLPYLNYSELALEHPNYFALHFNNEQPP
jgi:hypothetical protein